MRGIGASPGIAVGKVFVKHDDRLTVKNVAVEDPRQEIDRFTAALEQAREQLERLAARTREAAGDSEAAIFEAHLLILGDPELTGEVTATIDRELVSAAWALQEAAERHSQVLQQLNEPYLRERAADITDVSQRVMRNLLGIENTSFEELAEPSIIATRDLTPSAGTRTSPISTFPLKATPSSDCGESASACRMRSCFSPSSGPSCARAPAAASK